MKVSGFLAVTVAAVVMACEPAARPDRTAPSVAEQPIRDGDCAERHASSLRKPCRKGHFAREAEPVERVLHEGRRTEVFEAERRKGAGSTDVHEHVEVAALLLTAPEWRSHGFYCGEGGIVLMLMSCATFHVPSSFFQAVR